MSENDRELDGLETAVAELARASTPPEIFRAVLDNGEVGAPRVAIFLWRQGALRGWGCRGYPSASAERLRSLNVHGAETWMGRALESGEPSPRTDGETGPDFGQPPAAEAVAIPIRIGSRTLAIVLGERSDSDPPMRVGALRLLSTVARLRLEVDLAWRKLKGTTVDRAAAALESRQAAAAPEPPVPPAPAAQPTVEVGLAPATDPEEAPEQALRREARTFARLVATDIRLYNEEAVMLGRRHRDLAERLEDPLKKGRDSFRRRFPDMGAEGEALLQEAFVQVLAAGDSSLLTAGSG